MREITEGFIKALDIYLSKYISSEKAAKQVGLDLTRAEFLRLIREAYARGCIALHWPIDQEMCDKMRGWFRGRGRINMDFHVAKGKPDDWSFSLSAAERLMIFLKNMLLNEEIDPLNIGIVSGSSTASVVERLAETGLWEEIMEGRKTFNKQSINVIALNATPVIGWELAGNANIPTMKLAVLLREKLPKCKVTPFGISTDLVVKHTELKEVDKIPSSRSILQIADPKRLDSQSKKSSKLNLVITGVGTPDNSVFKQVLDTEGIATPEAMVGDVAFWPVDADGRELELKRNGKRYVIYSAVRLETMKYLATRTDCTVMLIARNSRREQTVDKTRAIRAAILGNYINAVFTDASTAASIISPSGQ